MNTLTKNKTHIKTTGYKKYLVNGYYKRYLKDINNYFLEESYTQDEYITLNY